ncbi:MAG: dicarboxylate/amino acid:cation symporter [Planktothrix sp.]|uniref:dicarboxylate/amino acid:cation symporter n=1 Tax=Planktothrix sp. TaxID=3088171 RepID=UPI0038D475C7
MKLSKKKSLSSKIINILKNPWLLLISIIFSIATGLLKPSLAFQLEPIGQMYLSLLKMCVLPILISAITMSIGRLMASNNATKSIKRIIIIFPMLMVFIAVIAILVAGITKPGTGLSATTLQNLGILVNKSGIDLEVALNQPLPPLKNQPGLGSFVISMIPDNIFDALSKGDTLKVLFFSIIFGISLGMIQDSTSASQAFLDGLEIIYRTFNKWISWLTLLLPFGLYSLLSAQIAHTGLNVVFAMVNFIVVAVFTYLLIYGMSTVLIGLRSRCQLSYVFSMAQEPTILALATTNALACLPSMISTMSQGLKFSLQTTNLVVPLGVTVGRFGQVVYFTLASVFVAQLYQISIGVSGLAIIIVGSIFAGMASSGATGMVTLTTLNVVLKPLGLPLEAALVLFIAIDPIMDPLRTLCTVHTAMAATALIADQDPKFFPLESESQQDLITT